MHAPSGYTTKGSWTFAVSGSHGLNCGACREVQAGVFAGAGTFLLEYLFQVLM